MPMTGLGAKITTTHRNQCPVDEMLKHVLVNQEMCAAQIQDEGWQGTIEGDGKGTSPYIADREVFQGEL